MVALLKKINMLKNEFLDCAQVLRRYPLITGKPDRFEPELALSFAGVNMNMWRLIPFIGIKVEPEPANSQDRWHIK
jgi:hypothetical protein